MKKVLFTKMFLTLVLALVFITFVGCETNKPELKPQPIDESKTISEVINGEDGTYTTKGTVVAISSRSFIIDDNSSKILVYLGANWTKDVTVGDKLVVEGTTSTFGGAKQFNEGTTYKKDGTQQINENSQVIDGAQLEAMAKAEKFAIKKVKFEGMLKVSGNYINVEVEGTEIIASVAYAINEEEVKALDGKKVEVEGYAAYTSGSGKYVNVITLGVKEIVMPEFKISYQALEVEVGNKLSLTVPSYSDVTWESSDSEVATVANGTVTAVKPGTATVTASYGDLSDSVVITVTSKKYVVRFLDKDGNILDEQKVEEGKAATAPQAPVVEGYTFVKWDKEFEEVKQNLICRALYGVTHKITYKLDGATLPEGTPTEFAEGYVFDLPTPTKPGYSFIGWTMEGSSTYILRISKTTKQDVVVVANFIVRDSYNITYKFNGGVSSELYQAKGTPVTSIPVDNYNYNNGKFWDGKYSSDLFLGLRDYNPGATFSDRIYIGIDAVSGLYTVINIQNSGPSAWPEGALYVLTISSSCGRYRTYHNSILNIKNGDIVTFSQSLDATTKDQPTSVNFYTPAIEANELNVDVKLADQLITPFRLGFDFDGWYDINNNKISNVSDLVTDCDLIAKWKELNPVTDIIVSNMPVEMTAYEKLQLDAKVSPDTAYFKTIKYSSSDKDVVSVDDGGLLTALNPGTCKITLTDFTDNVVKEYTITVYSDYQIDVEYDRQFSGVLKVGESVKLIPDTYGKDTDNATYTFATSDNKILEVDANGNVKAIALGVATITISDNTGKTSPLTVSILVDSLSKEEKLDKVLSLLKEYNMGVVQTGNACIYNDGTNRYYDDVYGSVNYYLFDDFVVNRSYEATAEANSGGHKSRRAVDTIEFVTVHDTATLTGTVESIASNMASGGTSIHYTVGNYATYSVVPEKYIAYHAGDGTGYSFSWIKTNVVAKDSKTAPEFDVVKSGSNYYFSINGETTTIQVPTTNNGKTISNPSKKHLPVTGPVWKVQDGFYYLGPSWACFSQNSSGVICNFGGNNNSIGIEMCVNVSNDSYDSWQRTARLVADILIRNNLDLSRVTMHNNWTGKNCPQVFISGSYWSEFMKMVEINYILAKDFADVEIEFTSNNKDIVSDTGRVLNPPKTTTTVSYQLIVKVGSQSKSATLYNVVPGSSTWTKWSGTYKSSKIWNNGVFLR